MPRNLLVLNDRFNEYSQHWSLDQEWEPRSASMRAAGVPDLDLLETYDTIVVIGPLEREDQAAELAGGLRLAVEAGLTLVILYPVDLEVLERNLVNTVSPGLLQVEELPIEGRVRASDQSFYRYFGAYGRAGVVFSSLASEAVRLGSVDGMPSSVLRHVGAGKLYLLPFQVAELSASYNPLVRSVLEAISSYEASSGDGLDLPGFIEEMRLPGEEEVLDRIEVLRSEIEEAEGDAAQLRRYRQVIGRATGDALEELTIEILNEVLSTTSYAAEDREDVKAEDFWFVEDGENRALAEVKGIGGSVNRQAVNQVDNHRAEHELSVEEMPGVLLVNPFRNSDDPAQRMLPVPADVIKHAVRLNVLVLRTRDLYFLLHQHRAGRPTGELLVEALGCGGGWLEVDETTLNIRDS